jgi:hypothetical protein
MENDKRITLCARRPDYGRYLLEVLVDFVANSRKITTIGPRVVAVVDGQTEYVIQQYRSFRRAKAGRVEMQSQLDEIGEIRWATLHGVDLK